MKKCIGYVYCDDCGKNMECKSKEGCPRQYDDKNEVGNKYRILDAKTGEEKKGKYFCLRIDANDPVERDIVNGALVFYADMQDEAGRCDYADNVRKFIAARGEGGEK